MPAATEPPLNVIDPDGGVPGAMAGGPEVSRYASPGASCARTAAAKTKVPATTPTSNLYMNLSPCVLQIKDRTNQIELAETITAVTPEEIGQCRGRLYDTGNALRPAAYAPGYGV